MTKKLLAPAAPWRHSNFATVARRRTETSGVGKQPLLIDFQCRDTLATLIEMTIWGNFARRRRP